MKKQERDFKGVWIPKDIWLNKDLTIVEKALLVEIDSLDNDPVKGCFAGYDHLADFVNLSEKRVQNIISDLKKRGYLTQCYFDGRNRGLRVLMPENGKAELPDMGEQNPRKGEPAIPYSGEQTPQIRESPIYRTSNTIRNTDSNTTTITKKENFDVVDDDQNCLSNSVEQNRTTALEIKKEKRNPPPVAPPPALTWPEILDEMLSQQIAIENICMVEKINPDECHERMKTFVRSQIGRAKSPKATVEDAMDHFCNWLPKNIKRSADNSPPKGRIAQIRENTRAGSLAVLEELANGTYTDPFAFNT